MTKILNLVPAPGHKGPPEVLRIDHWYASVFSVQPAPNNTTRIVMRSEGSRGARVFTVMGRYDIEGNKTVTFEPSPRRFAFGTPVFA